MRVVSGNTTTYCYFVAVDATDFTSRETGLSSWTVYRSRNGGAAAQWTTPTINETDSTNMPGVYELLIDEDTTLDSGFDSQEMAIHITHTGMAPVTRTIEIYRPKITAGETLTVGSGIASADITEISTDATAADTLELFCEALDQSTGQLDSGSLAADTITAASTAADFIAEVNAQVVDALATDTYAEPTGVPAATDDLATKIGWIYMMMRNKVTVTSSKKTVYGDDDAAEFEFDLQDDGTTFTSSEANAL